VHDTEKEVQTLSAQQEAEQGLISSLEEQRHKALVKLPAEWVARYSSLLQQVPNPYVPVINGICSGCSYAVLQKDLIDLRAHRMVYCKECYRLLYLEQG
jgi:predicted  nucleic acid-binding Zn-ribbon protein